jgi:exodeoxyribonuclease VII small subunit
MNEKEPVAGTLLSIEQAMERLESLIREMESGQLPLEQLITSYEEGVKLASQCQEKLDAAAKKFKLSRKTPPADRVWRIFLLPPMNHKPPFDRSLP